MRLKPKRIGGEIVLATASGADDMVLYGSRDALWLVHLPSADLTRVPWERVERADWDKESARLRVLEVGTYGETRPVHVAALDDPGRLLELIRERVTASVLLQRRVDLPDGRGLLVVARRPPGGGDVSWAYELDSGTDPDDPAVRDAAEAGLRAAQDELG